MENRTKRLLAFLSVFVLLLTAVMGRAGMSWAKAADIQGKASGEASTESHIEAASAYVKGFKNISLSSFVDSRNNVMSAGEYGFSGTQACDWNDFTLQDVQGNQLTGFDRTLLSLKVRFTGGTHTTRIQVAGKQTWNGFSIYSSGDGGSLYFADIYRMMTANPDEPIVLSKDVAGVDSFLNEEFILQISFAYGDYDNDGRKDDVQLCFYINGKQYNDELFTIYNCNIDAQFGNYLTLYREGEGTAIYMSSVVPENTNLTEITWCDFSKGGVAATDQLFSSSKDEVFGYRLNKEEISNMADTSFQAKLTFDTAGANNRIYFAGVHDWAGIFVFANADGTLSLYTIDGIAPNLGFLDGLFTFDYKKAEVTSFLNQEITLKITTEFADYDGDGEGNDVQLGFYFNGVLYNEQYLYAYDCKESFGNWLNIHPQNGNITIKSVRDNPIVPPETFTEITFLDFNIQDGTYKKNTIGDSYDLSVGGICKNSNLSATIFSGNVTYSVDTTATMCFAGKQGPWNGLRLSNTANGTLILTDCTGNPVGGFAGKEYDPVVAGTALVGKEVNLKISVQYADFDGDGIKGDVKLGVFFDDVLYENEYLYLKGYADYLGNNLGIYCDTDKASIIIASAGVDREPTETVQPNESFQKITFSFFGVADGTYAYDGSTDYTVSGKGSSSLDKTVLCGNILLSGRGEVNLMIGGKKSAWQGMRFMSKADGKIYLYWIGEESEGPIEVFDPVNTGINLIGKEFHFMLSTEIVDADGDGAVDDIRLGVWFNHALYKNQYIIILNRASELGKLFGVHCATEGTSVSLHSIPELIEGFDYSAYGLTENWENELLNTGLRAEVPVGGSKKPAPFTGDVIRAEKVLVAICGTAGALFFGICLILWRRKRSC